MSKIMPFLIQQETTRAVDQLITRQALLGEAGRMGLRVTPAEVRDELQHGRYAATFFPGGNFIGETEYEDMLQQANLTPVKFEQAVGDDILLTKLQALISGSASVSESEIHAEFIKQNSKVKFDYAVLKQDDLRKGLHPTDDRTEGVLREPQGELCEFDSGKAQGQVRGDRNQQGRGRCSGDAEMICGTTTMQHRDQYRVPEQVKVSHIWIKMPLPGRGRQGRRKGGRRGPASRRRFAQADQERAPSSKTWRRNIPKIRAAPTSAGRWAGSEEARWRRNLKRPRFLFPRGRSAMW